MHRHEQVKQDGKQNASDTADPQEPARLTIRAFLRLVAAEVVGRLKREQKQQQGTNMTRPKNSRTRSGDQS